MQDERATVADQGTNICPGNCGENNGFGTCDSSTGICSCSLGWTGPDCNDATCCPLWIVILAGSVVFLLCGSAVMMRFFKCCGLQKVFPHRAGPNGDLPVFKSNSLKKSASKSSLATTAVESGATSPTRVSRSSTSVTLESGTPKSQPSQDRDARSAPPRFSMAPAAATLANAQRARSSTNSQPGGSPTLRGSAWGEVAPANAQRLRRAQTDGGGGALGRSSHTDGGGGVGRSQTGGGPSIPSMGRAKTEDAPSASRPSESLPHLPAREDDCSPQVKQVQQKMRDMMDLPLLARKRTLKDLLVEHHPDKNSDSHATEVFQAVNNARSWFLHEPESEPRNEAGIKSA